MIKYNRLQMFFLVLLRLLIGWHIFYEGMVKLLDPQWSSLGFLRQSNGPLSGFAQWIISNSSVLSITDFLNIWGLICIGLGLLTGLFAQVASIAGSLLIFIYYLNYIPFIDTPTILSDGSYLLVNKTLIEAVTLGVLALFPTSRIYGLDHFLYKNKNLNDGNK
ncbi:MAG: DoxX subfamily [Phocaeicola sp.]|uniref:DoxX subfamily n=2 Tax=Phocaeicola sp. TaxID=2773926 RepID=UPI003F9FD4EA